MENEFLATLPEDIRGNEALKDITDVGSLAKSFIEAHGKAAASNQAWGDFFPEEAKTDPAFNRYKTPDELYRGIKEAQAMVGRKGLIIPNANSKPEEIQQFVKSLPENIRKEMGWPEDSTKYKFDIPADLPKELGVNEDALKPWAEVFHRLGLSQTQANGVLAAYLALGKDDFVNNANAKAEFAKKAETSLRNDPAWAGVKYDENMDKVIALLNKFGGEPLVNSFTALSNADPVKVPMMKALAQIGTAFMESGIRQNGFSPLMMDSQQASAKIKEILAAANSDRNHPYVNSSHPDHKKIRAEIEELYKIANSG